MSLHESDSPPVLTLVFPRRRSHSHLARQASLDKSFLFLCGVYVGVCVVLGASPLLMLAGSTSKPALGCVAHCWHWRGVEEQHWGNALRSEHKHPILWFSSENSSADLHLERQPKKVSFFLHVHCFTFTRSAFKLAVALKSHCWTDI